MKLGLYSIYDNIAEVFNKPFTEINDNSATRSFVESLNDRNNKTDYDLYRVGEFNDSNGELVSNKATKVYSGFDIKNKVVDIKEA